MSQVQRASLRLRGKQPQVVVTRDRGGFEVFHMPGELPPRRAKTYIVRGAHASGFLFRMHAPWTDHPHTRRSTWTRR
eukprot:457925-Amphidinium_carterae.1